MYEPNLPQSPHPIPHSSNPHDPTDSIVSAAISLLSLGTPPKNVDPQTLASMEKALRHHAIRIAHDDFGGMEMMLTTQTQVLHQLFSRAVGGFAGGGDTKDMRLYSNVAIQSQKGCRMTVREIAQLKKSRGEPDPVFR